jgi:uncharacterized protein involved in exopolysaccharide biosynthesis
MTSEPLEAYLRQLERALAVRGISSSRVIEEARDHLVDAIEDGTGRGLYVEAAEREAFERFGAPETIAAHVEAERHAMAKWKDSVAGSLGTVWRRKWWILVPAVLSAAATSVLSYYLLPIRYQSEASIVVVPGRVPQEFVRSTVTGHLSDRLQQINDRVMSRTGLESIIRDFNLFALERKTDPIDAVIAQMRSDIKVHIRTSNHRQDDDVGTFNISFVSATPRTALQVTERLASLFIEENLRDREMRAEGTIQFIDVQVKDVRRQIIEYEATLDGLRSQNLGRRLSQADLLPYEVLQETYKALLTKSQESRMAANLERRQIGEQFKIVDPARLPEQPVGLRPFSVNALGGLIGLTLALTCVAISSVRQGASGALRSPDA